MKKMIIVILGGIGLSLAYGKSNDPTESVKAKIEFHYNQGFLAWRAKDFPTALNHWTYYMEMQKRMGNKMGFGELKGVEVFYKDTVAYLSQSQAIKPRKNKYKKTLKRKRKNKGQENKGELNDNSKEIEKLIISAERAEKNGWLEAAYRLYHVALERDPNSEEIKKRYTRLKKEIYSN